MRSAQAQTTEEGVALFAGAAVVLIALLPAQRNLLGLLGHRLSDLLGGTFGVGAWWWPLFLADIGWGRLRRRNGQVLRSLKAIGLLLLLCLLLHWIAADGGSIGYAMDGALVGALGVGAYLSVFALAGLMAVRVLGRVRVAGLVQGGRRRLLAAWQAGTAQERQHHHALLRASCVGASGVEHEAVVLGEDVPIVSRPIAPLPSVPAPRACPPPLLVVRAEPREIDNNVPAPSNHEDPPQTPVPGLLTVVDAPAPYVLPAIGLLEQGDAGRAPDERTIKRTRLQLEEQLAGYGVEGSIDGVTTGPVLATYEYQPKIGTKLSKIRALAGELSMALERGVRVIAPLPGTARVGIEVPYAQAERAIIALRDLVEDPAWAQFSTAARLPIAVGRNSRGDAVYSDLALMPHVLVAGATGSGKSVALNVMLTSLLLTRTPQQLRLLMIDPKVVELAVYSQLQHLVAPVLSEMHEASAALTWAVGEMERRYQQLAEAGVRDVDAFNALPDVETMARLVIVVDEFGDLMMSRRKEIEPLLVRLAQKSRAAGVHLILATQRPSVDVVTGIIKANMPARIAMRTAQRVDSTTIIDQGGAEQLLGRGDALCLLPGNLELQRVHGALVTHEEVRAVCESLRAQGEASYDESVLARAPLETHDIDETHDSDDALYERAVAHVMAARECSASKLQRIYRLGWNRAAALVDRMEAEGIVGPPKKGGGVRDVLRA